MAPSSGIETRACEVCGAPAAWKSGTPDAAGKSIVRRQRFLCTGHGRAWGDFFSLHRKEILRSDKVGINFSLWQEAFDKFLMQVKP